MSNFFKPFYFVIFFIIFLTLFISIFFGPTMLGISPSSSYLPSTFLIPDGYFWPTPGYTGINSYFGRRISPTAGASSFHKGIDIASPEGSPFYAICDGKITYVGFLGGGGYTITLTAGNLKASYCHVSPIFIVTTGEIVKKGDCIGFVGPKNVYGVPRKPVF